MLDTRRIDHIRRTLEEGEPHMGAETEGIVTDPETLEVVHELGGLQPTQAVRRWICTSGGQAGARAAAVITPDVPETTIEANPGPLRSPRSTAAAQRLLAIIVDTALECLGEGTEGPSPQLLHGAAWRPPRITPADASLEAPTFKRLYYQFQIGVHGDKVGAAAGDHINLSAPWLGRLGKAEISRKMVEMTGRMRLLGGALSIGLSAASPLYFGANSRRSEPVYGTSLTTWESARLGHVWPGRTIMDVSGVFRSQVSFRRTMARFAQNGTLKSGRDVWLMARAQPGQHETGKPFDDVCHELGIDLSTAEGEARLRELLFASFRYGPSDIENDLRHDPQWQSLETWRQDHLERVIRAPRNRSEIRTLETPPCFDPSDGGGAYRTPYEYIKGIHAFVELLFIYLCENPEVVEDLEYGELELQAAKSNEQAVLHGGMDARIRWIPRNMRSMTARELLRRLLDEMQPLIGALDRNDDIAVVQAVADGEALAPAARMRREVGRWYGIDPELRHNAQLLPDDDYPRTLLQRTRAAMDEELDQIERDIPTVPALDRAPLTDYLELARRLRGLRTRS